MFVKQIFEDFENLENKKESNLNKTCCCRPAWGTDWDRSFLEKSVTFAVFTVAKHSMLMPAMMLRHISPDNSRAGIVTSPNVATRLSEKLVLR